MATKTNAVRLIIQHKIPCRECTYAYDEHDLNGNHAAAAIGMPPSQVFKTLVTQGDRCGIHVFCIPVNRELDFKKAAQVTGDKKVDMVPVKDLLPLTGYIRGGCSPVGMKKLYPTHFDESCKAFNEIAVSAGARGHQMIVPPIPLAELIHAKFADITKE